MKTLHATMMVAVLSFGFATAAPARAGWLEEQARKLKKTAEDTGKKIAEPFKALADKLSPKKKDKKKDEKKDESKPAPSSENPLPKYLPNLQAFVATADGCDKVFDALGAKVDGAYKGNGWWYPATCGVEFQRGLTCGLVKSFAGAAQMLQEAAQAAWQQRSLCVPGGTTVDNVATAIPALLCGLGIVQARQLANLPACVRSMSSVFKANSERLAQVLTKVGCELAGDFASGLMMGSAGGGAASSGLSLVVTALRKAVERVNTIREVATRIEQELKGSESVCR